MCCSSEWAALELVGDAAVGEIHEVFGIEVDMAWKAHGKALGNVKRMVGRMWGETA
jgi:hypothetical protein